MTRNTRRASSIEFEPVRIRLACDNEMDEAGDNAVRAFARLRGLLTPDDWTAMERGIRFTTAQDKLGTLLVAEQADTIVGSVRYTGPGHGGHVIYPDRFAYIRAVAVSPDFSRRGIGRKLTEACIEAAKQDMANAIGLHVAKANQNARALYRDLGFRWYRQALDYFGIPYEAYCIRFLQPG